ncbi:unnamed protein product [Linum trigynum]|uniref:Secreted protein n=1 Tax=Linum trigynum TaxID=586398 RepID=A0AAV2GS50_9ROSI
MLRHVFFGISRPLLVEVKSSLCRGDLTLTAYCDADWGGCPTTCRSTLGYFITLGSSPVPCRTKKQTVVAHSSAEGQYCVLEFT